MKSKIRILLFACIILASNTIFSQSWIRINQLGYSPESVKVGVFLSENARKISSFSLCEAESGRVVFKGKADLYDGSFWGMKGSARLDFSDFNRPGIYFLRAGNIMSPVFRIDSVVYKGTADFVLKYMRQQRCGYNPWLRDSCHTHDGFIVDHPTKTGEIIDVTGGWHDASDYLQYVTTSANAVYQMLYSYLQVPEIFGDRYDSGGNPGSNGLPDVLDEAKWGLEWLLKMNPDSGEMYNQVADDRDHRGFRLPNEDTATYGYSNYRPVYFVTGKPQGLGRYKNRTEGVSSTAGKYASAFAIGAEVFKNIDADFSQKLTAKASGAYKFGCTDIGTTQTACYLSPYFYEEDNYADDLELAAWQLFSLTGDSSFLAEADHWGLLEPVSPWIEKDTARHYQFYPFLNMGHLNMALSDTRYASKYTYFIHKALNLLNSRRQDDPFQVKIPFIWCSNNYVVAALAMHILYREASGDESFRYQEAALRDWLFGCNPWGTSMVCGLPESGDYPQYPHSAFTLYLDVTTEGGLIDGPVYSRIYNSLIGIRLLKPDQYERFNKGKVVYHDDIGDYSTNEPTMDGTACLVLVLALIERGN
ncbi:MAG: glycoside hydrolase family 9 protein [Bacteroidales bacterium]